MDMIKNYLMCFIFNAIPMLLGSAFVLLTGAILVTVLAAIGVATLITIPEIWAIVAALYGVAVAGIIVFCLLACGFPIVWGLLTSPIPDATNEATDRSYWPPNWKAGLLITSVSLMHQFIL